jgi:hypothetical protein
VGAGAAAAMPGMPEARMIAEHPRKHALKTARHRRGIPTEKDLKKLTFGIGACFTQASQSCKPHSFPLSRSYQFTSGDYLLYFR